MNPSSVIIDNTIPTVDFLPWIESQGYRIILSTNKNWIVATLMGIHVAVCGFKNITLMPFEGWGQTKEQSLDRLRQNCSGYIYHPNAKRKFFEIIAGQECQFPTFNSLS